MSVSVVVKNSCSTTGEGPHWDDATQSLLYVDIITGDVHRWNSVTGKDEKLHIDPSCRSLGVETSLIVPSSAGGYIVSVGRTLGHLDWDTNTYTQIAEVDHGTTNRFNDGKCDPKGRLWAGTMGRELAPAEPELEVGSLYTLDSQKKVTKYLDKLNISNGLAWSDDQRIMYFIDSLPGNIFAFDYDLERGRINATSKRVVLSFGNQGTDNEHGLPDGMAIDTEGKLWVACYSKGKVIRVDPETGKVMQEVKIPAARTTSCCFGGKNLDELYVTSARYGVTEEELKTTEALAGSVFKITGLGAKGKPASVFQA